MKNNLNPLAITRKLLSFNTINPPGNERDCAEYIGKLLEEGGFKVRFYEFDKKRTSLVARSEGMGGKAPICFSGHIDTVPLGAAAWSKDPFNGEIDGDKVFGRGASDMKGGVAAMVVAVLRLPEISKAAAGITLVITASEETGSKGAYHLSGPGSALGKAGALVVGEPTSNYPLVGHKGSLWLEAAATGVTAHGSMPEEGINAIYKAVEAVNRLQKYEFDFSPHPFLGTPTLNVGTISGGININSVPDQASIGIDIRTIPGQTNSHIYESLKSLLGKEIELKRLVDVGCVATDPQDEWVQKVFDIMEPFIKKRPEPRGVAYFTDASVLTPAFGNPPTVILGPGEPTMAHKTDEYCCVSKIEEAIEAYIEIAKNWFKL
jgi:succinyl-diaminopimelate desuccinylase